ncbi:MAG TPA: RNase P subunit [Nitrosopumilaceae archaeon]|nr:RNase P subunit [Nitrosopumilaceae archaeon]
MSESKMYFKRTDIYLTNMKPALRQIALERMQILIKNAISNARTNPKLAQRQASIAKKLSTKYRIRMPYDIRINFCKKCKKFIAPGVNARIRIGRSSVKSIRITCGFCNHTYRKIIQKSITKGQ